MMPIPDGGIFLDVACGDHKTPGAIGLDIRPLPGVDLVHDMTVHPWPLPDACAYRVLCSHILEHIPPDKILGVMAEMHRLLKPHGQLLIAMPYGVSPRALQDPTHFRCWVESVPQYWDCEYPLWQVYRPPCFKIEECAWHSIGDLNIILAKRDTEHGKYHEPLEPRHAEDADAS
jgi:predicted SAM-dependent methyltransferase